ncbi:MAG TPA: carbohydrate-binding domain-containing protein [Baekduia sp.]
MSCPPLLRRARVAVPTATALALAIIATGASADVTLTGARLAGNAASASGAGQTLALRTAKPVTATVRLTTPGTAVTVRARGVACAGSPVLAVAVDGAGRRTRRLSGGRYEALTVARALSAGAHHVTVALVNAHVQHGCRRAVVVDRVVVKTTRGAPSGAVPSAPQAMAVATPPAAPVIAALAAPAAQSSAPEPPAIADAPSSGDDGSPSGGDAPSSGTDGPPSGDTPPSGGDTTTPDAPPPPVDTRAKLAWAPPALNAPTTIDVAQGDQAYTLDTTKDYILNLGATTHLGAVSINGGRNVVMIGGRIGLSALSTKATALVIKNSTGTVHVEGVDFDGTSGHEMDAIQIVAPAATVQVENVRADNLLGTYSTNHSDVIQPYGGVARLRVDRLTADSNYQGIFTRPDLGAIGSVDLRHVDMSFNNAAAGSTGGYLLWMTTGCDMAPTSLSEVYIQPRAGKTLASAVWPTTTDAGCPAKLTGTRATWPGLPVTGAVNAGAPSGGSFVPVSGAGPGYVSPGYQ